MIHLNFILYFLSIIFATASLTGSILFFLHYRKKVLMYYGWMLAVPTLLLLDRIIELYCSGAIRLPSPIIPMLLLAIEKTAFSLGMFVGPFFTHSILGLSMSRLWKRIFISAACLYTCLAAAEVFAMHSSMVNLLRNGFSLALLFGMYCYCLALGTINIGKLASPFLKKVVIGLLGISFFILPFSLVQYFQQKPFLPGFIERPILFIGLFGVTIIFLVRYFDHPAYYAGKQLTDYFKKKFSITDRESDIILQVIQGHSNQLIGEKLFVSTRTVESHLYSIFQKLGIKSRVQLANLIQTNKND
jgi:DNA-binding CsgD family transcriptional regulator